MNLDVERVVEEVLASRWRGRTLREWMFPPEDSPEHRALLRFVAEVRGELAPVVVDTSMLPDVTPPPGGRVFRRRRRVEYVGLDPRRVQRPECWHPRQYEMALEWYDSKRWSRVEAQAFGSTDAGAGGADVEAGGRVAVQEHDAARWGRARSGA